MDIREFLEARLAEDQRAAEKAASLCGCHPPAPAWLFDDRDEGGATDGRILVVNDPHPVPRRKLSRRWSTSYDGLYMAEHIVRHDPARVLRDVESTRRILAQYEAVRDEVHSPKSAEHYANARARQFALDEVLRLLALPFAEHPDYDPSWSPESVTGDS